MKILISELRRLWKQEGIWGVWRGKLREGYNKEELYFEFGLMLDYKGIDVKIIVNHFYHINLFLNPDQNVGSKLE